MFKLLLIYLLWNKCAAAFSNEVGDCYANNSNPYLLFGTKTAYTRVYSSPPEKILPEGWAPFLLWGVVRHGTRNPFVSELSSLRQLRRLRDQILQNEEFYRSNVELCPEDLENLKSWTITLHHNDTGLLTAQGYKEMYTLGERVRQRFSQIFKKEYVADKFLIQSTNSLRSRSSAEAFVKGAFQVNNTKNMTSINDGLLKAYRNCTFWKLLYKTDRKFRHEYSHLMHMKVMKELSQNISKRLGFFFSLESSDVWTMYLMCRYDRAFNQSVHYVSPWCGVFTIDQLKILEFKEDLYYYYKHGFGLPINLKLGCPLLRDLILKFNGAVNDTRQSVSTVYFTTHGMFERLLSRLGFFNDTQPLKSTNITDERRLWRTSRIPFGANLFAVLYRSTMDTSQGYRVVFYLNEEILPVDGCEEGFCLWDDIKNRFYNITNIETCNLNDCYIGSAVSISKQTTFYIYCMLFATIIFVFFNAT
uniref:Multiple inositol polyphosphate phosphatase 1 n=2 Tax=Clastoptera arizonana TaxID=38151 RepID=A0A1B6EC57_9HEMI